MKRYRIYSEAGEDHGVWSGHDAVEALAARHRAAGYHVHAFEGALVWEQEGEADIAGDLEAWVIYEQRYR